jgi:hypothetical protein
MNPVKYKQFPGIIKRMSSLRKFFCSNSQKTIFPGSWASGGLTDSRNQQTKKPNLLILQKIGIFRDKIVNSNPMFAHLSIFPRLICYFRNTYLSMRIPINFYH